MNLSIGDDATDVAEEVAACIRAVPPTPEDIANIQKQRLSRHGVLPGLQAVVSAEETLESFFRCQITDHLMRLYEL